MMSRLGIVPLRIPGIESLHLPLPSRMRASGWYTNSRDHSVLHAPLRAFADTFAKGMERNWRITSQSSTRDK